MHIELRCRLHSLALAAGLIASSASVVAAAPLEPRIEQMTLQLTRAGFGRLGLLLAAHDRDRLLKEAAGRWTVVLDPRDAKVVFNDNGEGADLRRGDGVFSAEIPVDLTQLEQINAEVATLGVRSLSRFAPGTRGVIGTEELSATALDVTALRSGRLIRLPRLSEVGPLQTLGARRPRAINPDKSLLLRSLPIIEDAARTHNPCTNAAANNPLKAWSFGRLMTEMSMGSGLTPSQFVEQWLEHWRTQQQVFDSSGSILLDSVSTVAGTKLDSLVIDPWRARSGGGMLDLSSAPFRLLAIVNRPDLAVRSYGGAAANNGGELRFVFGLLDVRDKNQDGDALDTGDTCLATEMSVIFEYEVPITSCTTLKDWASDWIALSGLLPSDPLFGTQLQQLTEVVLPHGAAPAKPNQSALNQLRSNEIVLSGVWQFREFHIAAGNGPLRQVPIANNPREHQVPFTATALTPAPLNLNASALLLSELQTHLNDILHDDYSVQETVGGMPFQGGVSSYVINTTWDHSTLSTAAELEARFKFSLNTCSGCHTGETDTPFYHIVPTSPGNMPVLSNFLRDNPHEVIDKRGIPRQFKELDNRKQALTAMANQSCRLLSGVPPFQMLRPRLRSVH